MIVSAVLPGLIRADGTVDQQALRQLLTEIRYAAVSLWWSSPTPERPNDPVLGQVIYDTDTLEMLYCSAIRDHAIPAVWTPFGSGGGGAQGPQGAPGPQGPAGTGAQGPQGAPGGGFLQLDVYSTPGSFTWTKPTGATVVQAIVVGAGGGGGSGSAISTTSGVGASGGGGGAKHEMTFNPSLLGATESVVVGAGGVGGVGVSNSLQGNPGTGGGVSSFAGMVAYGGGAGAQGANAPGSGGGGGGIWSAGGPGDYLGGLSTGGEGGGLGSNGNVSPTGDNEKPWGGAPGGRGTTNSAGIAGLRAVQGAMGGAGGASATDASGVPGPFAGGVAADQYGVLTITGGSAPGGDGNSAAGIAETFQGAGGGGGASSKAIVSAGDGGDGQQPGGGGGGGGGTNTTTLASGRGGDGGDGIVIVITSASGGTGPGPPGPQGPQGVEPPINEPWTTLVDATTITVDAQGGDKHNFVVTLAGNRTLANPINMVDGMAFNILVIQDATGSRTLAYGSKWRFTGGTPTLTTAPNAADLIAGIYDLALDQIIAILAKNA